MGDPDVSSARDERGVAWGARVRLVLPKAGDARAFEQLVAASASHLHPWAPGPQGAAGTDAARWFRLILEANATGRSRKMLIQRRSDAALLGCMNLNEIVQGAFQNAFLGYWIGAPHVRRGYAAEALALVLAYAFGELQLHRLEANIQPGNEASIALVRRAGFRREGFSPRYLHILGAWRDHERWAITREDLEPS